MRGDPGYPDDIRKYDGVPGSPFYRDPHDPEADADEAMSGLYRAADALATLCDRHSGDNGDDAEMIEAWSARVTAIHEEIAAALGQPRVRGTHGGLVPVGRAP